MRKRLALNVATIGEAFLCQGERPNAARGCSREGVDRRIAIAGDLKVAGPADTRDTLPAPQDVVLDTTQ
jgi:hypothetical protein